jgi:hypothetical protein
MGARFASTKRKNAPAVEAAVVAAAVVVVVVAAAAAAVVVAAAVTMVGDRPFFGRGPNVGYVPGRDFTGSQPEGRKPPSPAKGAPGKAITITQQYRERHNMTYELDCAGEALVLRMFFPPEAGPVEWRIEARGKGAGEAVVIDRVAATRELAFQAVCGAWPTTSVPAAGAGYDWEGVTQVLRSVRAL